MKLRNHNSFSTIDYKGTFGSHVWNSTEVHILHNGFEIFVLRIGAIKFQFCLKRHAVCQPTVKTLFNRVSWWVNKVIQEFKHEVVSCIRNRKVFSENLEKTLVLTVFRRCFQLKEILERLNLNIQEVWILNRQLAGSEA